MTDAILGLSLAVAVLAPLAGTLAVGVGCLIGPRHPRESTAFRSVGAGLVVSLLASVAVSAGALGASGMREVEFGTWLRLGDYVIPLVALVDGLSITISVLAALLT